MADIGLTAPESYPWHQSLWQRLEHLANRNLLPHALMLTGPSGIGKEEFLQDWIARLVCDESAGDYRPCGECDRCRQHQTGSYPDCMVLTPEPASRRVFTAYPAQKSQQQSTTRKTPRTVIGIDQVRELIDKLTQSGHYGGLKIAVILPAEAMNREAANALLKILEEPPQGCLIILLTERPLKLLATIRSRCQRIDFPAPSRAEVGQWLGSDYDPGEVDSALQLTGGAPRHARELLKSGELKAWLEPIEHLSELASGSGTVAQIAGRWEKLDRPDLTNRLQIWLRLLIGSWAGLDSVGGEPLGKHLRVQKERVNLAGLWQLVDLLGRYVSSEKIVLNKRLMWEEFLLCWQGQCLKTNQNKR